MRTDQEFLSVLRQEVPSYLLAAQIHPSDTAPYSYGICPVRLCERVSLTASIALCRPHRENYKVSSTSMSMAEWATSVKESKPPRTGGMAVLGIFAPDLSGSKTLSLELRFGLHVRAKRGKPTNNAMFNALSRALAANKIRSLLELRHDPDGIDEVLSSLGGHAETASAFLFDSLDALCLLKGETPTRTLIGRASAGSDAYVDINHISEDWLRTTVDKWLNYRMAREAASAQHIAQQCRAMIRFASWASKNGYTSPMSIDRECLIGYVGHINKVACKPDGSMYSSSYRRDTLGALKTFLDDCRDNGWLQLDSRATFRQGDFPKMGPLTPRFIEPRHIAALRDPVNLRRILDEDHRLIVMIMIDTGMRCLHACSLRRDCLRNIALGGDGWALTYMDTKSNLVTTLPVPTYLAEAIRIRLAAVEGLDADYLFARTTKSGFVPPPTINVALEAYSRILDLREADGRRVNVTPHRFRHSFGTRMIEAGVPMHFLKKLMGHRSLAMTEIYAHMSDQTVRTEWEKVEPLLNIKGETVGTIDGENADFLFMKHRVKVHTQALPIGMCGLTPQQSCPHANPCLSCPAFCVSKKDLPALQDQRKRHIALMSEATTRGQLRIVEINRRPVEAIDALCTNLMKDDETTVDA